jgi:dipeptidyl aminopeptidase/acylaminoacyl peptidase
MIPIVSWIAILVFLLLLAALVMGFYLTKRSFLTEIHSPAEVGLAFEEVAFKSRDGLLLKGWWIPAPDSDQAIIQLHGHGGSMDPDIQYLPAWNAAGFSVLMFDFRGHGRSQGNISTFGYLERYDVQGAIQFLKAEKGIRRIALVGFSLGGMVAILSAPGCPEVAAVVEDGAPARIKSAIAVWGIEHHLPYWASKSLAWMAVFGASLRVGANLFRYEPVRWIGKIAPRPLMIIHGELDQYCPDFEDLLSAAKPTEVWRLPNVGHVQASQVFPEEYRKRVVSFLRCHL